MFLFILMFLLIVYSWATRANWSAPLVVHGRRMPKHTEKARG